MSVSNIMQYIALSSGLFCQIEGKSVFKKMGVGFICPKLKAKSMKIPKYKNLNILM